MIVDVILGLETQAVIDGHVGPDPPFVFRKQTGIFEGVCDLRLPVCNGQLAGAALGGCGVGRSGQTSGAALGRS